MKPNDETSRHKLRALEGYLAASSKLGDRRAMEQLVRHLSPGLLAHASRLSGDPDGAQDALQSAWVDILSGLQGLRDVSAVRSFAYRIVTRKVAKQIRQKQRERRLNDAVSTEAETTSQPLGEIASDAAIVRQAIDQLPTAQRATLALFYLEEMTVTEVSVALDVPTGTVKTRLMHARTKLSQILKGSENDQT